MNMTRRICVLTWMGMFLGPRFSGIMQLRNYGQVALESNSTIGKDQALALGSINVERALGLRSTSRSRDLVIYSGGDFSDMKSKVLGVMSSGRGNLEMFD